MIFKNWNRKYQSLFLYLWIGQRFLCQKQKSKGIAIKRRRGKTSTKHSRSLISFFFPKQWKSVSYKSVHSLTQPSLPGAGDQWAHPHETLSWKWVVWGNKHAKLKFVSWRAWRQRQAAVGRSCSAGDPCWHPAEAASAFSLMWFPHYGRAQRSALTFRPSWKFCKLPNIL